MFDSMPKAVIDSDVRVLRPQASDSFTGDKEPKAEPSEALYEREQHGGDKHG